jgi:hypothetical protein
MENLLVSESLLFISGWMPSGSEGLWEDGVHPASKITIEAGDSGGTKFVYFWIGTDLEFVGIGNL